MHAAVLLHHVWPCKRTAHMYDVRDLHVRWPLTSYVKFTQAAAHLIEALLLVIL